MRPSVAPNTTTRSHSRPFTRWMVESVTPPSARSRWNVRRSHASNEPASGCRSATWRSASRSSRWEPLAPPELSRRVMAEPSPMSSRTAVEQIARGGAALGQRRQPVEVDGEVVELLAHLRVVDAGRRAADVADGAAAVEPLGGPLRQAAARTTVHLAEVGAADVVGVDRDPQVGEGGAHAQARQHALVEDRVDRDAGIGQHDVRRQQQRLHPGEHRDLARDRRRAPPAMPARRRPAPARRCRRRGSAPRTRRVRLDRRARVGCPWRRARRCRRAASPPPR